MAVIQVPQIYDELLDYLASKATSQEILAFNASSEAQERASYLLDRNNAGTLTLEEEIELQQMLYFDGRISVLKARAAAKLKTQS
jgi:hypothetical protein